MRKTLSSLVVLSLLLFPTQFLIAAPVKAGASCTKLGQNQIVNGYKFTCIKSGKKLIWDKGVAIKKPSPSPSPTSTHSPSPTPSPSSITPTTPIFKYPHVGDPCTPIPNMALRYLREIGTTINGDLTVISCFPDGKFSQIWDGIIDPSGSLILPHSKLVINSFESYDSTSKFINDLVNSLKSSNLPSASTKFEYVIEPASISNFAETIKIDFEKSANFYQIIGLLPKYTKMIVILHSTQDFFHTQYENLCHPGSNENYQNWAGVFMGTCDEKGTGLIALNIAGIVTGNYSNSYSVFYPQLDLNTLPLKKDSLFSLNINPPHEFFHAYQNSVNPGFMNEAPVWLIEGSAQLMGLISLGVNEESPNSYLENLSMELEDFEFSPLYPDGCLNSLSTLIKYQTNECSYWQGIFPIETLVANHGGLSTLARLIEGLNSGDFSKDFKSATGLDLQQFYKEADIHSKYYGFASNT